MILLKLKFSEKTPHETFRKFNRSLLKDKQYLDEINELIDSVKVESMQGTQLAICLKMKYNFLFLMTRFWTSS